MRCITSSRLDCKTATGGLVCRTKQSSKTTGLLDCEYERCHQFTNHRGIAFQTSLNFRNI